MAKGLIQRATWRSTTLLLSDAGLIVGAVATAAYARQGNEAWSLLTSGNALPQVLLFAYVCQLCLYYGDVYDDPRVVADRRELIGRVLQALGATSLLLALIYFWFPPLALDRAVFPMAAGLVVVLIVAWRAAFAWLSRTVSQERLLLVGTSIAGHELARELTRRRELGVEIVGFVEPHPVGPGAGIEDNGILGTVDDIPAIVRAKGVDRVVVSLADARGKLPMDKLLDMKLEGVSFEHLTSVYEEYTGKIAIENLRPSWLIFSSGFQASTSLRIAKRATDVVCGFVGLVLSIPVIAVLGVAIKLTSQGPILYSQDRVGRQGRIFRVYKLRSMRQDAEQGTGPVWASKNDDRTTPLGRFLRKARLDELPQFWNVLCGNMSLIGPRPERPSFVHSLTRDIPFYGLRHVVKPGITGWAQVRYTYGATVEDAMQKLQYDLYYIKNFSLSLDLFIFFETIKTVILRRGQ